MAGFTQHGAFGALHGGSSPSAPRFPCPPAAALPTGSSLASAQVSIASLLLSILGTRLALHGPPGAMHSSVEGLTGYRKHTTYALIVGLFSFFVSAGIHPWIYASTRVALPASITVAVCAAGMALSMRRIGTVFRLPKRRKVVGYYRSEDFEPGSVRDSVSQRVEPGTPGRVIKLVQSRIIPADYLRERRRVQLGRLGAVPAPARGADAEALSGTPVGLPAGGSAFSGGWFGPTLFGNVPPPLGQGRSERVAAGRINGGGRATSGPGTATGSELALTASTELAPPASWFSRSARGAPHTQLVAAGRPAAPPAPPSVRASSSYEVMMRAEALELQGRFREAADLLAEKMEQLYRAQRAAAGAHPAASEGGSDSRADAARSWVAPSCWYESARPEADAASSLATSGKAVAVTAGGGTSHVGSSGNGASSAQEPRLHAARGGDHSDRPSWRAAPRHSAPASSVPAQDERRGWFGQMSHRWNLY
jgi:hypothetical protein